LIFLPFRLFFSEMSGPALALQQRKMAASPAAAQLFAESLLPLQKL
jgi:hypothetical protein